MQIELEILQIIAPSHDFVCFLVILFSCGTLRSMVIRSSTEVEYRTVADTNAEIIWLWKLLRDMGVDCSSPTPLDCDNQSAIKIPIHLVFHERIKHIEIGCYLTHRYSKTKIVTLPCIPSQLQIIDFFTNIKTRAVTSKLKRSMNRNPSMFILSPWKKRIQPTHPWFIGVKSTRAMII